MAQRNRSFGRDVAAVAGGLAAGVLGSRLLPPMLAAANGSVRARLGEGPFDRLFQDHRQILALLERMREAPDDSAAARMPLFLSLKRTLAKHALAEEDVVYPLLHGSAGSAAAAKGLYSEHADMKIHLHEIEETLKNDGSCAARLHSLHELIADHIRDEEGVQFPKLQPLLDERRSRAASGQIRREEAMIL